MLGVNIEILRKYVKLTCKFVRKIEIRQSEKISILYDIQDVTEVKMNLGNEAKLHFRHLKVKVVVSATYIPD